MMGANGPIGRAARANFGPGYLVGRVGAAGAVNRIAAPVWASDNTLTVAPIEGESHFDFLGHLLLFLRPEQLATKNAQPLVTQSNLGALQADVPAFLPEQRQIAEILDTIDEAIRKTEEIIAKLEQVKQGLLHDLLTRGIDENGELRDRDRHPEQFKDSPLGRIPREWNPSVLGQLVDPSRPIVYGILMPGYGYPGGVPVVKVRDIKNGEIGLGDLLLTSPKIDQEYRRSRLRPGDLLFTIRGTVGRTAFVPECLDQANITQDTARIGVISTNPTFVREYLRMAVPSAFIDTHTIGVAVKGINLRDVRRIPIALPPRCEADAIADRLNAARGRESAERESFAKLRLLKHGLMEDLLTGRVRVTKLLENAAE
jgi:type I restriction enzyme, S subunit